MSCVYVIDDDESVLKATTRVLRAAGFEVRPFASALAYLAQFDPEAPGCLVLDLNMPGLSGLQLQQELIDRRGKPSIVFLSGRADISMSVTAMKGGAVEFLEKPVDAPALMKAVHAAFEADHRERELRANRAVVARRLATLTPREEQVLRGVVAGKLNKQIAGELGTAEKTIKVHRGRVMEKMQVDSVAALVHAAARVDIG